MVWISRDAVSVVANIFISFIGAGVLGLPFAFKQAGLAEGGIVLILVAIGSVKAMLLLIDCKYKCLSVLMPDLANVKVNLGKDYIPVKNEDTSDEEDNKGHRPSSRRYLCVSILMYGLSFFLTYF